MLPNGWAIDASSNVKWRSHRTAGGSRETWKVFPVASLVSFQAGKILLRLSSILLSAYLPIYPCIYHLSIVHYLSIPSSALKPAERLYTTSLMSQKNQLASSSFCPFNNYAIILKRQTCEYSNHMECETDATATDFPGKLALKTMLILLFSKLKTEAKGHKCTRRWNLSSYFQSELIVPWGSASDLHHL